MSRIWRFGVCSSYWASRSWNAAYSSAAPHQSSHHLLDPAGQRADCALVLVRGLAVPVEHAANRLRPLLQGLALLHPLDHIRNALGLVSVVPTEPFNALGVAEVGVDAG